MRALCFAILTCSVFVLPVSAWAARSVTNAQRLARGLPPLPPRRLYHASSADSARKAKRSAAPLGVVYSCQGQSGYGGFCCSSYDPNATPQYGGCQASTSGLPNSFTCSNGLYATCCDGSGCVTSSTANSYTCPTSQYPVTACCDTTNTNTCSVANTPAVPGAPFTCPSPNDSSFRYPNCCTDTTYAHCNSGAHP